jgi:ADP-ribose pyrophosphatase
MANIKYKKIKEKKYKIVDNVSGYDKQFLSRTYKLPSGMIEHFFVDLGKDSVQIFPITENNEVILIKQFRPGNEEINIEIPGGGLDSPDENIEKAARRELVEETGFIPEKLDFICSLPYSPYSTGIRHSFVATGCKLQKQQDLDPNEFLSVHKVSLETFKELCLAAKVRGFDISLLALLKLQLL